MIRARVIAAVLLFAPTAVHSQQVRGKFNPDGAYHTNVQLAIGRLTAEVQAVIPEIAKMPPAIRRDLAPRADLASKRLAAYAQLLARNPAREQLRRDYGPIDESVRDLIDKCRNHTDANQQFVWHTAAISAANIQLEVAVTGPAAPDADRRPLAVRLARQLDVQSDTLLTIARSELRANRPLAVQLERELKAFALAA